MTDTERIAELERLVYQLYALLYRQSRQFVTTMPDGSIPKEELDKLKERLLPKVTT
jgi:hypothetical protein